MNFSTPPLAATKDYAGRPKDWGRTLASTVIEHSRVGEGYDERKGRGLC